MRNEFLESAGITLLFLFTGLALLHFELIDYGVALFIFLPFILGFILGSTTIKSLSFCGVITTFVIVIVILLVSKIEGVICIILAMPILIISLVIGVSFRKALMSFLKKDDKETLIKSSIIPFCVFLVFGLLESNLTENKENIVEVKSEMILPNIAMSVYDAIKTFDTLDTEKPFLMKLDLPIPQKCILDKEEVGGLRTCYFEGGKIVERITELEKGKLLKMDVIDYQLTGRKWLGFKEAIYIIDELDNGKTKITRVTTYTSELYPRFYWQPLEKIGIEQEHEYVFSNLKKKLDRKGVE